MIIGKACLCNQFQSIIYSLLFIIFLGKDCNLSESVFVLQKFHQTNFNFAHSCIFLTIKHEFPSGSEMIQDPLVIATVNYLKLFQCIFLRELFIPLISSLNVFVCVLCFSYFY